MGPGSHRDRLPGNHRGHIQREERINHRVRKWHADRGPFPTTVFYPRDCLLVFCKMRVAWSRLIRFVATDGRTLYGEPILTNPDFDIGDTTEKSGLQAKVVKGQDVYDTTGATKVTDEVVTVKKLLGPLAPADVPILRCVGLNYATHSKSFLFVK